ncbi:thermostable hemolysin [Colwelliaceae bacterium 6441]
MERISNDFLRASQFGDNQTKPVLANTRKRSQGDLAILSQCSLDMDVFSVGDIGRQNIEQFIRHGFAKSYGADISVNMPWVLAIKEGKFKAGLGIRSAIQTLFVEQYLDKPIEQYISTLADNVARKEIAEIGNLYSNAKRFTLPLFLVTAVSLFCNHYRYMVFSGTEHVLKLIKNTGIETTFISTADKEKLLPSNDDWGSYYDTKPNVVCVSLTGVMKIIEANELFSAMFTALSPKIISTTSRLKRGL